MRSNPMLVTALVAIPCLHSNLAAQQPQIRLVADLAPDAGALAARAPIAPVGARNVIALATPTGGSEPYSFGPSGQSIELLGDLAPATASSSPRVLLTYQNRVLFLATTADHGREVWQTDGTSSGTKLAFELATGAASSNVDQVVVLKNRLYFVADDGMTGSELWSWDGTTLIQIVDLHTGVAGSGIQNLSVVHDRLWFSADAGNGTGTEPYVSDGTSSGTRLIQDLVVGASGSSPRGFCAMPSGRVAFLANTATTNGIALWMTDGTSAGTTAIAAATGTANKLRSTGQRVVFEFDYGNGPELWASDGTSVGTLRLSAQQYDPRFVHRGSVLFQSGADLWTTDGTTNGTYRLLSNRLAVGVAQGRLLLSDNRQLTTFDVTTSRETFLLNTFATVSFGNGVLDRLWLLEAGGIFVHTDGTPAGTARVEVARVTTDSLPHGFVRVGKSAVFGTWMYSSTNNDAYYRTDVTTLNTQAVRYPTPVPSEPIAPFAGSLWCSADVTGIGVELAAFAPGDFKTRITHDLNPGPASSGPRVLTPAGRNLYFETLTPPAIWVHDGRSGSPQNLFALPGNTPAEITPWGEHALIRKRSNNQDQVHATDGTTNGSQLVLSDNTVEIVAVRQRDCILAASKGGAFLEPTRILVSDGTAAGTTLLYTSPSVGIRDLAEGCVLGDRYVIGTSDGLRVSDGSVAGTTWLNRGQLVTHVVKLDPATAAFVVARQSAGELWTTDGTVAGTTPVTTFSAPVETITAHGARWLRVVAGSRLYLCDATRAVALQASVSVSSDRDPAALVGDRLFLSANHSLYGREPHVVTGLRATASRIGEGCGSGGRVLQLESDAPRLGSIAELFVDRGLPTGFVVLALGSYTPDAFAGPAGCAIHLDPFSVVLTLPLALNQGAGRLPIVLPNSGALLGLEVAWQAFSPAPSFEASNALIWYLDQ
ncbi:MAG: hypothetical protein H6832_10340 [Planctomycetes bacterium]|nr:hypothetical protein [Planctomycetota bacterium]MCB9918788.1 hypothetical protein [Planctomycetota bacterium]